ncbi:MAG: hypothetical protein HUN04_22320 [Desulfobacter sp.]|nr:MAG: hypothetical protein HUN04_22320 [Desulfobacter sp.]
MERIKGKIIKSKLYYFDVVTVNFKISEEELIEILPLDKLMENGQPSRYGKMIHPASHKGRLAGYKSKIVATVCNEKFIRILKETLKENGLEGYLTKIEISCEYFPIILSLLYARELQRRFDGKIYRKWSRDKGFTYKIEISDSHTTYLAKEKGKTSNNFNKSYVSDSKILQRDKIYKPCFRVEFTISGTANVKRVLKINDIHDLKSAKEHYRILFKRYFKIPAIDRKKVLNIASEYYSGVKKPIAIANEINSYPKLQKWLKEIKEDIKRNKHGRRYRLKEVEKKILLYKNNHYFL